MKKYMRRVLRRRLTASVLEFIAIPKSRSPTVLHGMSPIRKREGQLFYRSKRLEFPLTIDTRVRGDERGAQTILARASSDTSNYRFYQMTILFRLGKHDN